MSYRTHTCGELTVAQVSETVRLAGWIHRKRDHGGVLFVDLRDHYGLTQIVTADKAMIDTLERTKLESVVQVEGKVVARSAETVNPNLPTGAVEVRVESMTLLSEAADLPLLVSSDLDYPEEIRLRYRFLDLRRERVHRNILLRSQVVASLRRRMQEQGFTEFQTPILTASSPEGARDFLVPSRLHPGQFYALPQAPQMFKQLLMVAGFDRYFQIAPCFRDEDARADRSPGEFYQLDFEMSFVTQEDVFAAIEPVLADVFREFAGFNRDSPWTVSASPFPRIPYAEAMRKYGTDKPDLRNPLVIEDVTEHFRGGGFGLFATLIDEGGVVRAIPAPGAGVRPRSFFDGLNKWAREEGWAGLGYINFKDGTAGGPIAKNLGDARVAAIVAQMQLGPNDGVFFASGPEAKAAELAGVARTRVGELLNLVEQESYRFCWIVDFPMFERDAESGKIDFSHNPFSMPQGELEALETQDPLEILAWQYDVVCNGVELSSGAIRNHRPDVMYKAFEIAGYSKEDVDKHFPGMLNAFRYGAPPHGGAAPGVDRMVMLLADEPNIREVTLFPLNQRGEDLMMGAPSAVSELQLRELGLRLPPKKAGKKPA